MDVLYVINIVILGLLAVASIVLAIFLVPVLRELRRTVGRIDTMADEEISPLVAQVRELIKETGPKIDSIMQKVDSLTEEQIEPLANNVKEITGTVNTEIAKVNVIVDTVGDMVSRTHKVVSLYQDQASMPAIEIISLWHGIKQGATMLFRKKGGN